MWVDNETDRDFVNFSGVADTVAEIIAQAKSRPISIGVSGVWGVGKTSLIKLTRRSLAARAKADGERDFVFVEFNAWLYQGYDDARAALMDVIAEKLAEEAAARQKALDKVGEFVKRIRWLRLGKLVAGDALAISLGLPPTGLLGGLFSLGRGLADGISQEELAAGKTKASELADAGKSLLKEKAETTPPKEIQALRDSFEEALEELGITLVVLIDDLDRCLPETTISTLEAIRLFLFLKHTAFVIAADDAMIKHAVRKHFDGVDDKLVNNYFDKLIQVPIRVPALGTQEVRAYMMLLFVENSSLDEVVKERVREGVCKRLQQTWQGKRVDRAFMVSLHPEMPQDLIARLDTAERLAPIMVGATDISGNPRLIKRFLNALAIRMTIAKAQGVSVDEAVLAKLLLFERLGDAAAYAELVSEVNQSDEGRMTRLSDWEERAAAGQELELTKHWDSNFVREWLALTPSLRAVDLRGALYVGREHAPLITAEDRLSSESADILAALLEHPEMAASLDKRLESVSRSDLDIMMNRVLNRARNEQQWGVPPILNAALALSKADPVQGGRLGTFLGDRPASQIQANIVPKISDQPWARGVFEKWAQSGVSKPVINAIGKTRDGNLTK